jgi:Fe2+ transport system protein FeoA
MSVCHRSLTFSQLSIGAKARVVGYHKGSQGLRHKLLSMGLTPGVEFKLIRVAPMGCPIQIEVRGYDLSLRKDETSLLQIELIK